MKHLLILLSIFLLLSSPLFGHPTGEHTLYLWETSSGKVWKGIGDKEFQLYYEGELKNGVKNLYDSKRNNDKYISYSYVSNQIRKKTAKLIDSFQSGLINVVDREDLTDLLQINDRFKELALEKPENRIISTDLADVNYFLHIIQKYK